MPTRLAAGQTISHCRIVDKFDLTRGMEHDAQSVALDPGYAAVWGRIAGGCDAPGLFGAMPPDDAFADLKDAAARALALDDSLADACGYRTLSRLCCGWD